MGVVSSRLKEACEELRMNVFCSRGGVEQSIPSLPAYPVVPQVVSAFNC